MNTDLITFESGGYYSCRIQVEGLNTLMRFLKQADPLLRKAIQRGLEEASQPILTKARANARAIADDGTFASSLTIVAGTTGKVSLRSTDEAAGVKEFAKRGARYKPKPTDKRRNARKMTSFPVGVPKRANPPRVMIPAVDGSIEEVKDRIDAKLEEVLEGANG